MVHSSRESVLSRIKDGLTKIAMDARPWAAWIWNLDITRSGALEQLEWFAANGFGGVAIRVGRDLNPAFLSEEFMQIFGAVLDAAAQSGIGVRFYTDFSRPWNTGMTTLIDRTPELRLHTLRLRSEQVVPAKEVFELEGVDETTTLVLAGLLEGGVLSLADTKVLKPNAQGVLTFRASAGDWKVLVIEKEYARDPVGGYTINVFNARAANACIQQVLELFLSRFSVHVGKTFKGFITEMPAILPSDGLVPWDDDLIIKYRAKHKKEILALLPSLFCPVEPAACRNRAHVYHYILQSMYERFALTIETWAKKHHLSQWVLCPERPTYPSEGALRDFGFHPELDLAFVGGQNCDGLLESGAVLRGIADVNTNEFRRETVAVIGRSRQGNAATIQELKSEFDAVSLGGVARILIDGCFYNLDHRSQLKSAFNPFWYSPDADKVKPLCDYMAVMTEALGGQHYARPVAVLNPAYSVLAEYTPAHAEAVEKAGEHFDRVVESLQDNHVAFDVISEHLLLSCSVRVNGEFGTADRIRKGNYQVLVIPYGTWVSKSLLVFIEKVIAKKGVVIFIGDPPQGSFEEGVTRNFSDRIKKLLATRRGRAEIVSADGFGAVAAGFEPQIALSVNGRPCPEVHVSLGCAEGYDLYLLHNTSGNQDFLADMDFASVKYLALLDPVLMELHEIDAVEKTEAGLSLHLHFSPLQTYLLVASQVRIAPPKNTRAKVHPVNLHWTRLRDYRIVFKNQWQFRPLSPNALPLATWNDRIGLSRESGGFSHFYEASFFARVVPRSCFLVLGGMPPQTGEPGGLSKTIEVTVNGTVRVLETAGGTVGAPVPPVTDLVVPVEPFSFFSNSLVADLSGVLVRGVNRISIRTIGFMSHPLSVSYPPLIVGDFSVKKDARGWVLDTVAQTFGYESWCKNGYPYFSGRALFRHVFEVPSTFDRLIMRFSRVTGSVSVGLNGTRLDTALWQPMEFDVTELCGAKRNELQVVTGNTVDNVLRMNGRPSGILGEVYLDVY